MFLLPDELFVSEAYLRILGRPADPPGFRAYLKALRRRLTRVRLLLDLQRSAEAAAVAATVRLRTHVAVDLWPARLDGRRHGMRRPSDSELLQLEGHLFDEALGHFFPQPADRPRLPANDLPERQARLAAARSGRRWWSGWSGPRRAAPGKRTAPARPGSPLPPPASPAEPPRARTLRDRTVFFTIATGRYLPLVRVLMTSVARHHPEAERILVLVDAAVPLAAAEPFDVVPANSIDPEAWTDMRLRYDVTELCTALKPSVFLWLMRSQGCREALYLDPDIECHAPLNAALDALRVGSAMVLTPHITRPLPEDGEPSDHTILRSGVFNLGFAAMARHEEAFRFLDWWQGRLRTGALVDFAANLFTDQRWCDMAPAFVPSLQVIRHPGWNVAYWNLPHRELTRADDGRWLSNGEALVFFHFSGVDPLDPKPVSRHQDRDWSDAAPVVALIASYAQAVRDAGWPIAGEWALGAIDGVHLGPTLRAWYRETHPRSSSLSERQVLSQWLEDCSLDASGLSPLMRFVHATRQDLQRHYRLEDPQERREYEAWFWAVGVVEHGLVDLLRRWAHPPAPKDRVGV